MAKKINDVLQDATVGNETRPSFLSSLVTKGAEVPGMSKVYHTAYDQAYHQAYETAYYTCDNSKALVKPENPGLKAQEELERRAKKVSEEVQL